MIFFYIQLSLVVLSVFLLSRYLLIPSCLLLSLVQLVVSIDNELQFDIQTCVWAQTRLECKEERKHMDNLIGVCTPNQCRKCIHKWKSILVTQEGLQIEPHHFIIQQTLVETGLDVAFECTQDGERCDCYNLPCTGSDEFCAEIKCANESTCFCNLQAAKTVMLHKDQDGVESSNFSIVSYKECLRKNGEIIKPIGVTRPPVMKGRRNLLSVENYNVNVGSDFIKFYDPIITVSQKGTVIIRKDGLELVENTSEKNQVIVPDDFLIDSGYLEVIFITAKSKTLENKFYVEGRDICKRITCILCLAFFKNYKCMPNTLTYLIVSLLIIVTGVVIICLQAILVNTGRIIQTLYSYSKILWRALKTMARLCMLCGLVSGSRIRSKAASAKQRLEQLGDEERDITVKSQNKLKPFHAIMIISLFVLILSGGISGNPKCTEHKTLVSKTEECIEDLTGTKCSVTTQGQITLSNLGFSLCIWISDQQSNHLFTISLTFKDVICNWPTVRAYYTFVAKINLIHQVACPGNAYCSWGVHCHRNYKFDALTTESLEWPGVTDCHPDDAAVSGCFWRNDYHSCHHYRWFLKPKLETLYEIRQISGSICYPVLQVHVSETNSTLSRTLEISQSSVEVLPGITIEPVGTYDQPTTHIERYLAVNLQNPTEIHLENASPANAPQKELLGGIQARTPFDTNFIFDPDMSKPSFYSGGMRLDVFPQPLEKLMEHKQNLLPTTRFNHRLYMGEKKTLKSKLIRSAPTVVHLSVHNYKVTIATQRVCPKIQEIVSIKGCYLCHTMAILTIKALSTCMPGAAQISFEEIKISTRSIELATSEETHEIQFRTDEKCITDVFCLITRAAKSCESLKFCLDEPIIILERGNYTQVNSRATGALGGSFLGWGGFGGFLGAAFTWLLYPIYIIVAVLGGLYVFSMCMSFFKR